MKEKLKSLQAHDKELSNHMKNPQAKISADLSEMMKSIQKGAKK